MTTASLKAAKEAFVTGHDGSTPWEVLLVCMAVVSGSVLYDQAATAWWSAATAHHRANPFGGSGSSSSKSSPKQQQPQQQQLDLTLIGMEALFVWFPMVLTQTNYLYPWGVTIMVVQILATIALRRRNGRNESLEGATTESTKIRTAEPTKPRLDYLTLYRSSILYLTFVAILAVDFPLFPRRFCKTEVSGYGLMDVGAASFCLSAGFVSLRARRKYGTVGGSIRNSGLFKPLWHTLPLLVIGMIRIVANRELEYQEHVSEYGVHWNFFFTMGVLALVPPVVSLLVVVDRNHQHDPSWVLPASIMGLYQLCLTMGNWQEFIEEAPRRCNADLQAWIDDLEHSNLLQVLVQGLPPVLCSFLTANREGVLGCLGYLSLYFTGEWIAYHWIWKPSATRIQTKHGLGLLALILWVLHVVMVDGLHIPVSRRSTNLSFCLWAVAHNVLLLYFLQLMTNWKTTGSTRIDDGATIFILPGVWETVNRHGLLTFLIANLLTGLVNLTVPTLDVSDPYALVIVFLYISLVGAAALLLDRLYCILLKRGGISIMKTTDPGRKKEL